MLKTPIRKLLTLLSVGGLIVAWPTTVYCDPFTAFAATWYGAMIISASISAASMGIQYLAQKKQKTANIDRGKVDDIRASVPGYGEFIPKIWGLARIAPIWVWESPAVDHPVTTPGHSGGKMPTGGGGTPTTVDHVYLKSVAGVFHDGPLYGKQPVRRIWFDTDLVASFITAELSSVRYEAEFGVLSGGATVATQAECSGGKKVTGIGSGGKCTVSVTTIADNYELAVHYTSLTDLTYKVYVDGVLLGDLVCAASGAATIVAIAAYPTPMALTMGDHLIRFENSGAACPDLDGVDLAMAMTIDPIDTRNFTSTIDVNRIGPLNQDYGWAYQNFLPDPGDGGGAGGATGTPATSFNLGKYGQPSIRIYRGTRTQLADPAIVAQEGADSASAYRGFGYIVIQDVQLQGGRMPNVTLEVDQGIHSVPAIAQDIYSLVAVMPTQLNVTALNGLSLGDSDIDPGTYAAPTWQNKTNTTSGANGAITKTGGADNSYNAGASHNATLAAATNGAIRFTASLGSFTMGWSTSATPTNTSHILFGIQCHHSDLSSNNRLTLQAAISGNNGTIDIGAWAPGDLFQIEIRNGKFRAYQNGIELGGFTPPVATFPLYPAFIAYSSGAGVTATTVSLAGAIGEEPSAGAGGLLLSSRRSAGDLLSDLQTRFQFDMVEVDGVVKAILRNGSGSGFSPTDIVGCALWLKADSLSLSDGAAVASWTDSSGNGNDATQSNGAAKPTYKTAILNGQPVVRFDGNDSMNTPCAVPTKYTAFIVYTNRTGTNGTMLGTSSSPCVLLRDTQIFTNSGTSVFSVSSLNAHNLLVLNLDYDNDLYSAYFEGTLNASDTTATAPVTGDFIAGASFGGSEPLTGDVAEIVIYDSILSTGNRQLVENYLGDKYGITVANPLASTSDTDITIPYTDMRAVTVEPGSLPELPAFDCQISDIDPFLLPARVDVNYLDPGMDYHNNTQSDFKLDEEPQQDNQSVSLAIIDSADNMKRLAIVLRHKAIMEGRAFVFQTSWKYMHVHPGSVASLTLPNATHTVRITQAKYQIPAGVIEFQAVRQAASLYSPTATGSISTGYEAPIAAIPSNTKGVIIDGPLLRAEDAGDGTQPVVYIAMCGRGAGAWPGSFVYQEYPRGSLNYPNILTTATQASQIGVTVGALATVTDPSVWDRINTLVINFYTPTTLSSVTEAELLANPELNLLAIVKPTTGEVEYIQFKTVVAGTPVAPYLAKYTIDTFLRGRAGTDGNVGIHAAGDDVVIVDSTLKPRRMELADIGI